MVVTVALKSKVLDLHYSAIKREIAASLSNGQGLRCIGT